MTTLQGRNCVVVGSSRGIGLAAARAIAAAGASVAVLSREAAAAEAVAATLRADGARAAGFEVDVRDDASVERAVAAAEAALGPLTLAFHNAGELRAPAPLPKIPPAQFREVVEVNLFGVFHSLRALLPRMAAAGGGSIVVNAATSGLRGRPMIGDYAAGKWGAIGLALAAAAESGPQGVRVNVVAPGSIASESWRSMMGAQADALAARLPLRRIGTPDEVAEVVAWLLSDAARYITGAVLPVDGGLLAAT